MADDPSTTCPSCGAAVTGPFCPKCGTGVRARRCPRCRAEQRPGARYCDACGAGLAPGTVTAAAPGGSRVNPWLLAGGGAVLLLLVLVGLAWRERGSAAAATPPAAEAPFAAGGGTGEAPPDISNMSPQERFDRLYNRIMSAAEQGDEATVTRFTPMALQAYQQLDSVDTDARFHAALLDLHTGQVAAAQALADTILTQHPGNLLGYVIRANAARWERNDQALGPVYRDFLAHYDAEMKSGRPEYQSHERTLTDLHAAALAAVGSGAGGGGKGTP